MRIFADYHTHTIYSHGTGTIEESVKRAIEAGLKEIAITDHDKTHIFYGIKKGYHQEIARVRDLYSGSITVLSGIEANITSLSGIWDFERLNKYDIVVLGYHKAVYYRDLGSTFYFYLDKGDIEKNTKAYINAINSAKIDIIAHPDYGICADWTEISKACAKTGSAIEINNTNINISPETVNVFIDNGAKLCVSSDAHSPPDIGSFSNALAFLSKTNACAKDIINAEEI